MLDRSLRDPRLQESVDVVSRGLLTEHHWDVYYEECKIEVVESSFPCWRCHCSAFECFLCYGSDMTEMLMIDNGVVDTYRVNIGTFLRSLFINIFGISKTTSRLWTIVSNFCRLVHYVKYLIVLFTSVASWMRKVAQDHLSEGSQRFIQPCHDPGHEWQAFVFRACFISDCR